MTQKSACPDPSINSGLKAPVEGTFAGHEDFLLSKQAGRRRILALNQRGSTSDVASISTGETLEIYGDGNQTRDFIYIDDLIRAIRLAANVTGIGGETFQIATNVETTVIELVDKLLSILADNGFPKVKVKPAEPRRGDIRRNFSDSSKVKIKLGWQAQLTLNRWPEADCGVVFEKVNNQLTIN